MAGETILIVDDERSIQRILEFNLRKAGYETRLAEDGLQAMARMREAKPDLVVLDVMMPNMDGYEVCREIRSDTDLRDVLVVLLTARGQEIDRDKGVEVGADVYATKPFSPRILLQTIRDLLDTRSQ
ncbi:MAG TPA: response regulator [bacterium]|nr:response regulator [bacterium]